MILTQAQISYDVVARERKDGGFRDSYAWHKRIWETFPGNSQSKRTFLTRLDDTGHGFRLLIFSNTQPTCPNWCLPVNWESRIVADSFFQQKNYHFSLLANPTKKLVVREANGIRKKNGQRIALSKHEDLMAWIERKGAQNGFIFDPTLIKISPRSRQNFLKQGKGGTHTAIEFSGRLSVNDSTAFWKAATQGIGSAKAFGFGLLCLSPIQL